jgi:hypothetical protein
MTSTTTDQLDQQQPDPHDQCHRCERPLLGEDTVPEVTMFLAAAEAPDGSDLVEFGERHVHAAPCATLTELRADRVALAEAERVIADQHEREERRLPLTDEEERAAQVFGVEPRDPDDYGSLA